MSHHVEVISSMTCLECGHHVSDHRSHDRDREPKFYPGKKVCLARGCACKEFRQPHVTKTYVQV